MKSLAPGKNDRAAEGIDESPVPQSAPRGVLQAMAS